MTQAATSTDLAASLADLRGLHLPANAAGAVQGEVVAAIILGFVAALLVGAVRAWRTRRRSTVRRAALRELQAARGLEPEARLVAQARLLRRTARTLDGDAVADLRGAAWAARLDRIFATDFFGQGAGRILVEGLYGRRAASPDVEAIDAEITRLLARIRA
ncbi:DUF4381 domain-containing protein [Methylobacterium oxalidis]|uniref:DUF4381 domain-containing protein n=1 Tax=Methylobacterium oxalidis TaxID=944322 RepID=A0A512IYR2_9HYPH|nr:DUF4381 domain-containing protein [Methylobacterium oxalidis]GEP02851.1 hypothetical protein MOX02_08890 [Methylobacterium oxalidis]GJE32654.1 hypothetical protein LDDCCGHA_2842 [Methylobacterium oxalidis]GLS66748.1 hypothetical protein GCM10007888_51310 [Methylobacterium oxalidis]